MHIKVTRQHCPFYVLTSIVPACRGSRTGVGAAQGWSGSLQAVCSPGRHTAPTSQTAGQMTRAQMESSSSNTEMEPGRKVSFQSRR